MFRFNLDCRIWGDCLFYYLGIHGSARDISYRKKCSGERNRVARRQLGFMVTSSHHLGLIVIEVSSVAADGFGYLVDYLVYLRYTGNSQSSHFQIDLNERDFRTHLCQKVT